MRSRRARPSSLIGRRAERAQLEAVLDKVRRGTSAVLVLRGEPGVGKSALLADAEEQAEGCLVVRAAGFESEMQLAFAALHQLCSPLMDGLPRLPAPQRDALSTAFGLRSGSPPDRFHVGLAALSLLSDAAEAQPLVCVVDDVQWLDQASAQALAFVARRLRADPVAMLFAARRSPGPQPLDGLPELAVDGLDDADARTLLRSVVAGLLDDQLLDRLVAETHGNPLALLELPRGPGPVGLAGEVAPVDASELSRRIEDSYHQRLAPLPEATRRLLLTAALEPVGDPVRIWAAAEVLGLGGDVTGPAVEVGLVEAGDGVRFRHPLVRSAVIRAASDEDRRDANRALAQATDPGVDPDRRAWHRAQAVAGVDEEVADELERSAERARGRGGLAAAAAFHERAMELTPDIRRRAQRALRAAREKLQAGDGEAAARLVTVAQAGPLDALEHARAELLRAQIAFATTHGRDAPGLLLAAARRLESLDETLARETYLDAFAASFAAGRMADEVDAYDIAQAVLSADWEPAIRACDVLLDGLAMLVTQGYVAAAPSLKRALRSFLEDPLAEEDALRWLWLACRVARGLGDDASLDELTARQVRLARRRGALTLLPAALNERFAVDLVAGRIDAAAALVVEADAIIEATGSRVRPQAEIWLAVFRGQEAQAEELIRSHEKDVIDRGEGLWLQATEWTRALLYLALGRYEQALTSAERAVEGAGELGIAISAVPELVEAAVRSGHPERAAELMPRLTTVARACDTDWSVGLEARTRALLNEGSEAETLYLEAIERLGRTRIRMALGRAQLLYGEWLRREGRRVDSREQLRAAHVAFGEMGAEAWAERARRELVASGETARRRTSDTRDLLTPQEAQIAHLVSLGATNPEVGAQLFLSPRTVEWHLHNVFAKLGIASRKQLREALADARLSPSSG
jgi:DNA-binding CsgD family transcriptional regulator